MAAQRSTRSKAARAALVGALVGLTGGLLAACGTPTGAARSGVASPTTGAAPSPQAEPSAAAQPAQPDPGGSGDLSSTDQEALNADDLQIQQALDQMDQSLTGSDPSVASQEGDVPSN